MTATDTEDEAGRLQRRVRELETTINALRASIESKGSASIAAASTRAVVRPVRPSASVPPSQQWTGMLPQSRATSLAPTAGEDELEKLAREAREGWNPVELPTQQGAVATQHGAAHVNYLQELAGEDLDDGLDPLAHFTDAYMKQVGDPTANPNPDIDMLFKLQMLKAVTRLNHTSAGAGEEETDGQGIRGVARSMRSYAALKNRIHTQPTMFIKQFIAEVEERLGVAPNQPYTLRDHARRIQWGRFRSLHRVYLMLGEIFGLLDAGKPLQAQALVTL